jgi:putative heme-binding domain-containing protein
MRPRAIVGVAVLGIAARLAAQPPSASADYAQADITFGAQVYAAQCTTCHGETGDGVGGVDLRAGKFRTATTDQSLQLVIANGVPGTGMNAFRLSPAEMTGVIAYLRNMNRFDPASVKTGSAARGRGIVEQRNCLRCHRIEAQGSRVGPDLSDIGLVRSAGSLQRSILDPNSQMMPINRPVRAVTRDGTMINGRRLNEDTYTVQLIDDQERLHSLPKADLREFQVLTASTMPSYKDLTEEQLADLLAYLLSLQGR